MVHKAKIIVPLGGGIDLQITVRVELQYDDKACFLSIVERMSISQRFFMEGPEP